MAAARRVMCVRVFHLIRVQPSFFKKATRDCRIVHSFIKLNDATIPAQTPIPRKDMVLDSMSGSVIFSAIDLADAFYWIRMQPSD